MSEQFVDAYRDLKPSLLTFFSSFGRPKFHASLDWGAWAAGKFRGMPQAYENLNAQHLKPAQCVDDWARFFQRATAAADTWVLRGARQASSPGCAARPERP